MSKEQFLSGIRGSYRALPNKRPEGGGDAVRFGSGAEDEREIARGFYTGGFGDAEGAEFELLRDSPAGDEADAEPGLDGGFDGFGGIELEDASEALEMDACFFKREFDDAPGTGTGLTKEQGMGFELRGGEAGGLETGGSDENQLVFHERFGVNAGLARGTFDEAERNILIQNELDDFAGVSAAYRELRARLFGEESGQQARQNVLSDGGGDAQREFSGDMAILRGERLFGFGDDGGEAGGVVEEQFALCGQGDMAAGAIEEADAQVFFERFDLQRDGGLGEKELLGGLAEAQVVGHGAEDLQPEVLELGHLTIMGRAGSGPVSI